MKNAILDALHSMSFYTYARINGTQVFRDGPDSWEVCDSNGQTQVLPLTAAQEAVLLSRLPRERSGAQVTQSERRGPCPHCGGETRAYLLTQETAAPYMTPTVYVVEVHCAECGRVSR